MDAHKARVMEGGRTVASLICSNMLGSQMSQSQHSTLEHFRTLGMDVHQATTVVAVIDAEGKIVLETIVATAAGPIRRLIESISGPVHVTLEERRKPSGCTTFFRDWLLKSSYAIRDETNY